MRRRIAIVSACIAIAGIIGGLFLFFSNHVVLNGEFLDCAAEHIVLTGDSMPSMKKLHRFEQLKVMDLGDISCSVSEYDALCAEFPDCDIRWQVPFQAEYVNSTASELHVVSFNESDIDMLQYFPELETVDARGCTNYDALLKLRDAYPDLDVFYEIELVDGQRLRETATECTVTDENVQQIREMIPYLPELHIIYAQNCKDYDALMDIRSENPDINVQYSVEIGQNSYPGDVTELTLDVSDAAAAYELLQYFPDLQSVTFNGLATDADLMYQMMCAYPDVIVAWEFEVYGVKTSSTATELYLNQIQMDSVEQVENALKYFYHLEWVEMCQCGIPSEEMDALWKRHPEIRFVWAIPMANSFVRTDVKAFIPFKYGYDIDLPFYDNQAKELKYLVDLECLDVGHMRMKDISFLQYMPKLRYLIVADTVAEDYSVIGTLKELIYLEIFITPVDDASFLLELTKLEDLNVGKTRFDDPMILAKMTWLKRLWAFNAGLNSSEVELLIKSLPDTTVNIDGTHPTDMGWRQSPNYYDMRDMLDMFYMK